MNWWQRLRRREDLDRQLDAELRDHVERETADYVRMGIPEAEARRRARYSLGAEQQLKDDCRDVRGTRWVRDSAQDFTLALRLLLKDRWFVLPAVLTLALAIGMNGTMFAVVRALVRGLPVDRPDLIMSLHAREATGEWRGHGISYRDFQDFTHGTTAFAGLAAFRQSSVAIGDNGHASELTSTTYVSANTFSLLGERPVLGRDFSADDNGIGAPSVVIIGNRIWHSRYNADPSVIGRNVSINGTRTTVIGVMPDGFRFPIVSDAWLPLGRLPNVASEPRDKHSLQVIGRRADARSTASAREEIEAIASRLARDYPATNAGIGVVIEEFPGPFAPIRILMALQVAVGFILLLACINVAKLLLARSLGRLGEFSLRAALGASRGRLVRQLFIESAVLAVPAGALGAGLAMAGLRLFERSVTGITFPYYIHWKFDAIASLFILGVCVITSLFIGLVPTLHALKAASARALSGGMAALRAGIRRRLTTALLTVEMALTLVLLAGAGFMMRSFFAVYSVDSIVDADQIATLSLSLSETKFPTPGQRAAGFDQLIERIERLPGVSAAAFANVLPFAGGPSRLLSYDGVGSATGVAAPRVSFVTVRGDYFDALGLRLLRGRMLSDGDAMTGSEGAIVNQRLVAVFFRDGDPIGQRICLAPTDAEGDGNPSCATIVGVSPTVRQQYFQELDSVVYVPDRAESSGRMLLVHASPLNDALAPLIRAELFAFDPAIALNAIVPLDRFMTQSRWGHRVFGGILSVMALMGVVLAAVGLYAVTAFAAASRTREIGLRMALGAQRASLVRLLAKEAGAPVFVGLAIGLVGALGVGRLVRAFLIDTTPTEPSVLVGIVAVLATTALAAIIWPARRATRLDALAALRSN